MVRRICRNGNIVKISLTGTVVAMRTAQIKSRRPYITRYGKLHLYIDPIGFTDYARPVENRFASIRSRKFQPDSQTGWIGRRNLFYPRRSPENAARQGAELAFGK
jgi:hypothetical protein